MVRSQCNVAAANSQDLYYPHLTLITLACPLSPKGNTRGCFFLFSASSSSPSSSSNSSPKVLFPERTMADKSLSYTYIELSSSQDGKQNDHSHSQCQAQTTNA